MKACLYVCMCVGVRPIGIGIDVGTDAERSVSRLSVEMKRLL